MSGGLPACNRADLLPSDATKGPLYPGLPKRFRVPVIAYEGPIDR